MAKVVYESAETPQLASRRRRVVQNGPKGTVAQARRNLYARAVVHAKNALTAGFPLEAVAIIESMIADRLEAFSSALAGQEGASRGFRTWGRISNHLGRDSGLDPGLISDLESWMQNRNKVLHQAVKVSEAGNDGWDGFLNFAAETATAGMKLFRRLDAATAPRNRVLARTKSGKPGI